MTDERLTLFAPQAPVLARDDVRLERFPKQAVAQLNGRIGPLANVRSSAGCWIGLRAATPWVQLEVDRLRHHQPTPCGIDLEVLAADGTTATVTCSPDLREQQGTLSVRLATGLAAGEVADMRILLPAISTLAVTGVSLPAQAEVMLPTPPPAPHLLALGDSLTQGFCAQQPTQGWVPRITGPRGWTAWNLGVGGITIEPDVFAWALDQQHWPVVVVALGSNHAWRASDAAVAAERAAELAERVLAAAPDRVIWVLPPWKPCEDGLGPSEFMGIPLDHAAGVRAHRVRQAIGTVLDRYPTIQQVHDPMPHDHRLYPDGLHPAATGFASYAAAIAEQLD